MIQSYSTSRILADGINQAVMYGAPSDVVANLRGALAFVRHDGADGGKASQPIINTLVPNGPAEGVTQDE